MKRFISAILGVLLILIVVYFGIKSGNDNKYIVPFGIASALIAPIGISALGYSFKKEDSTLQQLALVPEIDNLIEKAKTETEKIEQLKIEKEKILYYTECQAKRIAKIERKKILEEEAVRILYEYQKVCYELDELDRKEPDIESMNEDFQKLYNIINQQEGAHENGIAHSIHAALSAAMEAYYMPAKLIVDVVSELVIVMQRAIRDIFKNLK